MAYPCMICSKQFKTEHAFITHWGITHNNQLIEHSLQALAEARRHHADTTENKQVQTVVRGVAKPTK